MRATCLPAITAAMALALVAACGATEQPDRQCAASDTVQGTAQDAAPDVARITAIIEQAGFSCEVRERHPEKFIQVVDCRSKQDKDRKLIASQWKDPAARDAMYRNKMPGMCGTLGLKEQVRWSTSGNWALVAGAGTDKDVDALNQATDALGFESHAVPCR